MMMGSDAHHDDGTETRPEETSGSFPQQLPQVSIDPPDSQNPPSVWSGSAAAAPPQSRHRLVPPPLIPIPNIVVQPVPVRDAFGHSRTPPFVPSPSEWSSGGFSGSSRWRLNAPAIGRKPRALSDSSIVSIDRGQHDALAQPPASALDLSQDRSRIFSFDNVPVSQQDVHLEPDRRTPVSQTSPVPMETTQSASVESPHHQQTESAMRTSSPKSGPSPLHHFHHLHASGMEKSPKTYWLRRHSDSTVTDSLDQAPGTIRSRSTGDCIPDSPGPYPTRSRPHIGVSPLAESASEERPSEIEPKATDVGELEEAVVHRRLKLKKYLQKRYQRSQRQRQLSSDTDDVFSDRGLDTPSPRSTTAQAFQFHSSSIGEEVAKTEEASSASLPSTSDEKMKPSGDIGRFRKPPDLVLHDTSAVIKTEPFTPGPETPVFTSPGFPVNRAPASADAVLVSWQGPSVFQFRSASLDRELDVMPSTPPASRVYSGGRGVRPRRQAAVDNPDLITGEVGRSEELRGGQGERYERCLDDSGTVPPFQSVDQSTGVPLMSSYPSAPPSLTSYSPGGLASGWGMSGGMMMSPKGVSTSALPSSSSSPSVHPSLSSPPQQQQQQQQQYSASTSGSRMTKLEPSKIIYCPFSEQVQEQRHSRDPHTTFMCPVCGQVFPSYNYLANHMVNHLPSEVVSKGPGDSSKLHLCKVCNRSFSRSDMLTRHMRLHTGLRPYECRTCGQVFSRSDHLHTHLRTHTGEKPYRCPQCPYAAPRRDMITRHMRIHMKHFSPRRGRRSSSTSSSIERTSPDRPVVTSVDLPTGDIRQRNQSLSSVESIDSSLDHSPFRRHSSSTEILEVESLIPKTRSWSATSEGSTELGLELEKSPHHLIPNPWSHGSTESTDYPSPREPPSPPYRQHRTLQRRYFFQTGGSSSSGDSIEGASGNWRGRSADFSMQQEGHSGSGVWTTHHTLSPVLSPSHPELSPGSDPVSAEIQSSFQKCTVNSDKESSSGSDKDVVMSMSPTHPKMQ